MGNPSDGSYSEGAIGINSETKVVDSIDSLNELALNILKGTAVSALDFTSDKTTGGSPLTVTLTPTVVGTRADKIAQQRKSISNFAKTPSGELAGITGGVLATSNLKKVKPSSFKPAAIKGGKVGRRSAGK